MRIALTLLGAPRTKKNSRRHVRVKGRTIPLPSAAYEAWAAPLRCQLLLLVEQGNMLPLAEPVHVAATFYRDANRGDLVGYMQALADLLEDGGIVADDKWIHGWDGTRLALDRQRPRVELTLTWGAS